MALKATIYKAEVQIADMQRHYYDTLQLTIAQHPSETEKRMMIRLLAFILNAHEHLQMTKGLSTDDEPDIWQVNLSGEVDLWIELGLPDEKRIRKALGRSPHVIVYSYGGGNADIWWQKNQQKFSKLKGLSVYRISEEDVDALAKLVARTMQIQCTIEQGEAWLSDEQQSIAVAPQRLL